MISLLTGNLIHASASGDIVIDVHGIGFSVQMPINAKFGTIGEPITVHTYLAVREDAMELYGFSSSEDKQVFQTLLGVSGIGAKTAIAAIGALGGEGIAVAVSQGDHKTLTQVPGIGPKTAQRIVVDIQEKMAKLTVFTEGSSGLSTQQTAASTGGTIERDYAVMAIVQLGFTKEQAINALDNVDPTLAVEGQLRLALKSLS